MLTDEHGAGIAENRNRREVFARIVFQVGIERNIGRQRARGVGHHERITVGIGARDLTNRDRAAGAGTVVDHECLAGGLSDAIENNARHDIGDACGRERHHHPHRTVGIIGRARLGRRQRYES